MLEHQKISLWSAIFMNINIIAGAGLFINTVILTQYTGLASSSMYLFVGLFMLPLISVIAQLVKRYPSGGFYSFAKNLSPFLGFISCWSYFIAKLASSSLVLYVSTVFLQQLFPNTLGTLHPLLISCSILSLFTYLNLFNVQTGSLIQQSFLTAKAVPIITIILLGCFFFEPSNLTWSHVRLEGIPSAIPLVLYCLAGFEAACSISRNIVDPEHNGPKVIFYSFLLVIGIYSVFQFLASVILIEQIDQISSYQNGFVYLATHNNLPTWMTSKLSSMLSFFISFSALGGAYGMLFSNHWNLYTLAEHNHTFFAQQITRLNNHHIPTVAVLIEAAICALFLCITQGSQVPLQQTAALGTTLAYTVSVIGFLHSNKRCHFSKLLGHSALITCYGFIASCIISSLQQSLTSLIMFTLMITLGSAMFFIHQNQGGLFTRSAK